MSYQNRVRLLEIAIKNRIIILEDDPYSKLRLNGEKMESFYQISREKFKNKDVVIAVRSFSKIIGPGLRCGYVLADRETIAYMNSWLQKELNTTDRISQRIVAAFLNSNYLPKQLEKIRKTYAPLRDQMIASLNNWMPEGVTWTEPEGGMFVWVTLPTAINSDRLFDKAITEKVAFLPGSKFYPKNHEKFNGMRLNFTYPTREQIRIGVKRLAKVVTDNK